MNSSESIILARSTDGAEASARIINGDVLSIVGELISEENRDRIRQMRPREIAVEYDPTHFEWLADALGLARSIAGPATTLRLVIPPGDNPMPGSDDIEALAGWAVTGVSVVGDVTCLHVSALSEDLDPSATMDSIRGATLMARMLQTVADPASGELPDFEYRSSLVTSYLTEIPRLHAERATLKRELKELEESSSRKTATKRSGLQTSDVTTESQLTPSSDVSSSQKRSATSRRKKLLLLAVGAALWVGASAAFVLVTDAGIDSFLSLVVLGTLLGVAYDSRRRDIGLHAIARQGARAARIADQTRKEMNRRHQKTSAAIQLLSEAIEETFNAVEDHIDSVIASSTAAIVSETRKPMEPVRQIASAIESHSATAALQHEQILKTFPKISDVQTLVRAELLTGYRQIEANFQLRDLVRVIGPTPQLRGWAASPDLLVFMIGELRRIRPKLIVECGSGASTVWLAMASRSADIETRIVSLEHDPVYAEETNRLLSESGLGDIAEARLAPLENLILDQYEGPWYSRDAIGDLDNIGLVFVDGPPGTLHPLVRYPALPLLRPRLAANATVVLDDFIRDQEQEIANRWSEEFPELKMTEHQFEKGAAVLRLLANRQTETPQSSR